METTTRKANIRRTKQYIKLKHSIQSCTDAKQVETLYDRVQAHIVKHNHEDDLMGVYLIKLGTLTPELSEQEIKSINPK